MALLESLRRATSLRSLALVSEPMPSYLAYLDALPKFTHLQRLTFNALGLSPEVRDDKCSPTRDAVR
jgi:hypothetical protein